jgi:hypothetical protein
MKFPSWLFGIASALAGLFDLIWGEFEPAHQPIQAWSDHIPGISILARIAAVWLILGGLALLFRPAARAGAAALTLLYTIFCLFPLPRIITAPHYMGHHPSVYTGVFLSIGQQVIVFVGALLLWLSFFPPRAGALRLAIIGKWLFGLSCIDFGLAHFTFLSRHPDRHTGCAGGTAHGSYAVSLQRAHTYAAHLCQAPRPHYLGIRCLQPDRRSRRLDPVCLADLLQVISLDP